MSDRKRAIDIGSTSSKKKNKPTDGNDIDINGGVNPYTQRPYSENFYKILEKRLSLPVIKFKSVRHEIVCFLFVFFVFFFL